MAAAIAFPNIHEQHGRQAKAVRLADVLDALNLKPSQAIRLDGSQWECFAEIAQVRTPSEDTKRLAIDTLRSREEIRTRVAHCVMEGLSQLI